jgi:ribonuclease HI
MAQAKYYVVWVGRKPGVYATWAECRQQIDGFPEARYKSYPTRAEAEQAYRDGWKKHWGKGRDGGADPADSLAAGTGPFADTAATEEDTFDPDSISVDVGTHGNPGPVEYKGVDTRTGEVLFAVGPIPKGTNNLGEFLAIVHGLAYLKKLGSSKTVYSDSENAIKWVKAKKVSTTLPRDESTKEIWALIDRAERWLRTNEYPNRVLKWKTEKWGEIKADYGRK